MVGCFQQDRCHFRYQIQFDPFRKHQKTSNLHNTPTALSKVWMTEELYFFILLQIILSKAIRDKGVCGSKKGTLECLVLFGDICRLMLSHAVSCCLMLSHAVSESGTRRWVKSLGQDMRTRPAPRGCATIPAAAP